VDVTVAGTVNAYEFLPVDVAKIKARLMVISIVELQSVSIPISGTGGNPNSALLLLDNNECLGEFVLFHRADLP
jgi:hypothetical protein